MDEYDKITTKLDLLNQIENYLDEVSQICKSIDLGEILKFANAVINVKKSRGRLFFIGVGGSAGNASHAVNDFRKILGVESYAITDNVSELTARINDNGWATCYSDWLDVSNLTSKDAIVVFSVGGGSQDTSYNICQAAKFALNAGAKILSIVSRDGGFVRTVSDVCVLVPVVNNDRITPHAEEWQAILWHLIVSFLKENNYA